MTGTAPPVRLRDFPNRSNSLNAIRLGLATCVIVSHAWPIGGFGEDPRWGRLDLGHFAVAGFFAISGWLIAQSRLSSELASYSWRRFLRIYPGYLVSLLAVAFLVAPVGSLLGAGPYSVGDGVRHVVANLTMEIKEFDVGGTPADVPFAGAWNGSLWTLFHEAACYVIVGLLVTVLGRRWFPAAVIALLVGTTALELAATSGALAVDGTLASFLSLAPYFFAGATLFVLRDVLPLHGAAALAATVWAGAVVAAGGDPVLAGLPLAYLMLWLGAVLPLRRVGRTNDVSYGMYIYAFPVQQLLVLAGATQWGVWPYTLLCVACTVPFAAASWFLVERPAQRFRRAADSFPWVRSGLRVERRAAVS